LNVELIAEKDLVLDYENAREQAKSYEKEIKYLEEKISKLRQS
jgi:hypothetical protein